METYCKVDDDFFDYDKVKILPAIKGIRGVHSGRYTEMIDFYLSMEKWAEKENQVTTGKSIEVYKIGPHMVPNDTDYLTIIILEIL